MSTTTLGFGRDFHEDLLVGMADAGRGNFDEYSLGEGAIALPDFTYAYQDQSWWWRSIDIAGSVTLTPQ